MELAITGKGNAALRGGAPGDLLIVIEEEEHPNLKRDDKNLHYESYISFLDAVFGGEMTVPTLEGEQTVSIPAGIQSGHTVTLKGKGLPSVKSSTRGDQFIHLHIWTPNNLTAAEREQLHQLRKSPNFLPGNNEKQPNSFFEKIKRMFS
jgi:molecular chaperone DnaJ